MYLQRGHEVGFIGASDTHQAKPGYNHPLFHPSEHSQFGGLAAILAPSKTNDAIFDAMRSLSAYATSGQRIILQADLNGAGMGTRQPYTLERVLTCRVMGTSPIDQIEVIKNGQVVYGQDFLSTPLKSRVWIQVAFESSSEVFGEEPDNPRPYRQWIGTLDVGGARIRSVQTPGFDNRHFEFAAIDEDKPSRIRFHTETRGRRDVMLVELEGAGAAPCSGFKPKRAGSSSIHLPSSDRWLKSRRWMYAFASAISAETGSPTNFRWVNTSTRSVSRPSIRTGLRTRPSSSPTWNLPARETTTMFV